ncbi:hypothetical protein BGZ65_010201, partial [Modicella reniformis]
MLCIVKATLAKEHRRFLFATIDTTNIQQSAAELRFETLHTKLCTLFKQPKLSIVFEDLNGSKGIIQSDADVAAAVVHSSKFVSADSSSIVLKLAVEPQL